MAKTFVPDKAFEKYVKFVLRWLKDRVGLNQYTIKVTFVNFIGSDGVYPKEDGGYFAQVEINEMYLEIKVDISKKLQKRFLEGNEEGLIVTLVHELSHWFTKPYDEFFNEMLQKVSPSIRKGFEDRFTVLDERQTEFISTAIRNNLGEISKF